MENDKKSIKNKYSKDFKYTLKSKCGKVLLESVVAFGNKSKPFPKEWEGDVHANYALSNYKEKFIESNFDIEIEEV
jgi:mRNA-degrading endonuclease YafQ of YafQ-DinJ toxin-antitoxin module